MYGPSLEANWCSYKTMDKIYQLLKYIDLAEMSILRLKAGSFDIKCVCAYMCMHIWLLICVYVDTYSHVLSAICVVKIKHVVLFLLGKYSFKLSNN